VPLAALDPVLFDSGNGVLIAKAQTRRRAKSEVRQGTR
jgi:hypothetical protein